MRTSATRASRAGLVAAGVLAAAVLAGCSGNSHASTPAANTATGGAIRPAPALASTALGPLVITGGYIPKPASPDVAAAYLTITNNGDTADKLTKVTTSVTATVMPMTETDHGGVGAMTSLSNLTVPAHGRIRFVPDHAHLMLENPKPLKAGDQVSMTLTFTPAGTANITLPVLPLADIPAG